MEREYFTQPMLVMRELFLGILLFHKLLNFIFLHLYLFFYKIFSRAGKGIRLTYDHKASDQSEIDRIQSTCGFVVMARVNGILAVSRSLGDRAMKPYVSGEPYTTRTELTEEDTHVILACDGVFIFLFFSIPFSLK